MLFTACFILLLHSFVPHQHHSQDSFQISSATCVHNENNIIGFLGQIFHTDLGSGHLENFHPAKKAVDPLVPFLAANIIYEIPLVVLSGNPKYQAPLLVFCSDQILVRNLLLRGPPQV